MCLGLPLQTRDKRKTLLVQLVSLCDPKNVHSMHSYLRTAEVCMKSADAAVKDLRTTNQAGANTKWRRQSSSRKARDQVDQVFTQCVLSYNVSRSLAKLWVQPRNCCTS